MTTQVPPAFFTTDGDHFVPTAMAKGPWGPTISGNFLGGVVGHVVEMAVDDHALQPARLTVVLRWPATWPVR